MNTLRHKIKNENLQKLFLDLDTSGDSQLSISEFSHLLWRIDKDLNAFEIKHIFDEIDVDGSGEIDF